MRKNTTLGFENAIKEVKVIIKIKKNTRQNYYYFTEIDMSRVYRKSSQITSFHLRWNSCNWR